MMKKTYRENIEEISKYFQKDKQRLKRIPKKSLQST